MSTGGSSALLTLALFATPITLGEDNGTRTVPPEFELSHQNVCRATPITWGRIANVVMVQGMVGEHTRRARTTSSAMNSIGVELEPRESGPARGKTAMTRT